MLVASFPAAILGACSPSGMNGSLRVEAEPVKSRGLYTLVLLDFYITRSAILRQQWGGSVTRIVPIDSARLKELYAKYFDSLPTISNTSVSHDDKSSCALLIKLDLLS